MDICSVFSQEEVKGRRREERQSLTVLVESHFSLAALVQNTDQIFGPIIVTYFATQANQLLNKNKL